MGNNILTNNYFPLYNNYAYKDKINLDEGRALHT